MPLGLLVSLPILLEHRTCVANTGMQVVPSLVQIILLLRDEKI